MHTPTHAKLPTTLPKQTVSEHPLPEPQWPKQHQVLRTPQYRQNHRLHYPNRWYLSTHCPCPHGPSTRQILHQTPRHHQPNGQGRRRCEAELLRDGGEEEMLFLSPLNTTPPSPGLRPQPLTPPPAPSSTRQSPLPAQLSPACATPDHPLPTTTPVIISTLPSSHRLPPMPTPTTANLVLDAPPATGPPTPPPRPEAYVFSADPDRIECRKCCNRH